MAKVEPLPRMRIANTAMKTETLSTLLDKAFPEPNTGCFIWGGCVDRHGYGQVKHRGRQWKAHRLALVLTGVPISDNEVADHKCRNTSCVNPEHIRAATVQQNSLWGIGPTAINAAKTECIHGHPLSGPNVYHANGGRFCKTCRAAAQRRWVARTKAKIIKS